MNQQTKDSNQVMEWLTEELNGYSKLFSIIEKQKVLVDNYNESNLMETIQEKERIMERLNKVGQKIQHKVATLSRDEHNELTEKTKTIRKKIKLLLTNILALETYCENILKEVKSDFHGKVKLFRKNRTVLKGYGPSSLKRSSFSKNV